MPGLCVHSLRATAATNALGQAADLAKVQEWLAHAHIATTRLYCRVISRECEGYPVTWIGSAAGSPGGCVLK